MRAKIIFPNLIAVLVVGLAGYLYLIHDLRAKAVLRMRERMEGARLLFERSEILRGYELLQNVRAQAMTRGIVDAFAPVEARPNEQLTQEQLDKEIRQAWFTKCAAALEECADVWMQKKGKRPDIAFLTDRNGTVIARNISPHACPTGHNVGAVMPYVKRALGGEANYAIWSIDDSPFSSTKPHRDYCQLINTGLLEVAAVPVWYADNIAGVLVVGIELSNGAAKEKAEMVDFHLAVVKGGAVYSSSFATDTVRQSLEQQIDKPGIAAKIDSVLRSGVSSETFDIQIGDEPFIAIATPVLSSDKKDKLVNLMMGSVREALEDLDALNLLIAFMAVAILIVIVAGVILGNHFLKPVMAIEEGLLKIINGEYGYRFDINSKEVGGLGYRINQLIGVLTDEEEKEDQR